MDDSSEIIGTYDWEQDSDPKKIWLLFLFLCSFFTMFLLLFLLFRHCQSDRFSIPIKKVMKRQEKRAENNVSTLKSWSCYPDLNWGPHPYQLIKKVL